jgi:hypothetical protein
MHRRGSSQTDDEIMRVQLERLAASILARSPHELAEIASLNPAIYNEWITEIGRRNAQARQEADKMSKALESLRQASGRSGTSSPQ